jgi:hypothetical protein
MYPVYILDFIHIQVLAYDVFGEPLRTLTVRMSFKIARGKGVANIIGIRKSDNLFCYRYVSHTGLNTITRSIINVIIKGHKPMKNYIISYYPRRVH